MGTQGTTFVRLASPFVLASAPALAQSELWSSSAPTSGERYGLVVSSLGDVDGDGVGDVVLGAPNSDLGGSESGAVTVLSGADGSVLFSVPGRSPWDSLGFAVAGIGDVDGDGAGDLVAGARFSDAAGSDFGEALVLSGATGALIHVVLGQSTNGRFGEAVGAAGDVDADGVPDFIVGARLDTSTGPALGRARVFSGATGLELFSIDGDGSADFFGRAVGCAEDLDGDGHGDFFVSAPGDDDGGSSSGSLRIYSGADGSVLRRFDGDQSGDQLGVKAGSLGDLDGDGVPEFGIGLIGSDLGVTDGGAVRVHRGSDGSELFLFPGSAVGGEFGTAVNPAGDANGDGFADILTGARLDLGAGGLITGSISLWSGFDGSLIERIEGPSDLSQFGDSAIGFGDANGDGFDDVFVGAFGDDVVFAYSGRDVLGDRICGPAVPNSTGNPARILAEGSDVAADNDLTLTVTHLPAGVFGIFVTSPDLFTIQNPGGSAGDLCIASLEIGRYNGSVLSTGPDGTVSLGLDLTEVPLPNSVTAVTAGETRYWQYWFRDGQNSSNFSDAVGVTFQ